MEPDEALAMLEVLEQAPSRLKDAGWPWALAKATIDPFDYAVGLRDGTVLRFHEADASADHRWVTLLGCQHANGYRDDVAVVQWRDGRQKAPYGFPRGFVVRVEEIVWATDAPEGS